MLSLWRCVAGPIFRIPGIGPKKEQILIDNGYSSPDDIREADFYDIVGLPGFGYKTAFTIWNHLGIELGYPGMRKATDPMTDPVMIENKKIVPWRDYKKTSSVELTPFDDTPEKTTMWSYPKRGDWATHTPQYRGNWPPQVARNLIKRYSQPGDTVLDPMAGGGTTSVECKLLNRNSISVDINADATSIILDRLDFEMPDDESNHDVYVGDARNLDLIPDESIDFIATHPPYANIIHYAPLVRGDLSALSDYGLFFNEFRKIIREMRRVLKNGSYCAIMIGDTHSSSHFVPISTHLMLDFLGEGFVLKEDIIKSEWNCTSDRYLAKYSGAEFLLTMHEHIFVFEKSEGKRFKNSSRRFFEDNLPTRCCRNS